MSENLRVDPDAIDTFASNLTALAAANADVANYLESWLVLDNTVWGDGGLIRTGVPGTRRPDRERVVTPDDDDADDAYFRDRRRRGWWE